MIACARRRPVISRLYRDMARLQRTLTPEEEAARREKRLQATRDRNRRLHADPAYLANKAADMRHRQADPEYRERENQAKHDGARWSNFRITGSPYDNVTLFGMTLVVCAYCLVYGMLIWYLDNVWPWQYGIPKDPLFFTKKSYWFYRGRGQVTVSESTTESSEPNAPIEGVGDRTNPGIVLNDVTKASCQDACENSPAQLRRG
ncbi:hypothetical protein HPB49_014680 [Dermacentor silvarum]|uniref:Uncharacterized protein n=1 Tax=Dermacentor silvarum TaxID=543639 RepID=A0ACB8CXH8_DERSI|nr:hypothetical protein HPB49_014680 [Dermacentor silvarum]